MITPQSPKKGLGCFFYGCLTTVILAVLLAVGGFFVMRYVISTAVNTYTQASPMALSKVEISADEVGKLQARVKLFNDALDRGKPGAVLVLTEKELNALIANEPGFKGLKDKVYVSLEGNQIKGQISYPLDKIGPMDFKGRYLNGEAAFNVSLQNGILNVTLQSLKVAGQEPPREFMQAFRQENLAKEACKDAETAKVIGKLENITVRDGQLIIIGRASSKTL